MDECNAALWLDIKASQMAAYSEITSLNKKIWLDSDDKDSIQMLDILADSRELQSTVMERNDFRDFLQKIINTLPDRLAMVIENRFWFVENQETMTLEQIAVKLWISRERVRQLEQDAMISLIKKFKANWINEKTVVSLLKSYK